MIIALTLEEKFEQAIEFARDHPFPIENGFIGNLLLIPYCYYRLEQNEECLKSMALLYFRWVFESKKRGCHLFRLMTIPLDKA